MLRKKNSRDIILHTESQFYLPGDEVIGTVTYHPKKQVSLRFVKIIFSGEEFCIWIDKAARVGGPVAASRTQLFKKETNLLADRTRVEAGPHTWQFRFYIPRNIPPTCNYNGKANVSYWLKAKAATSFGHFDARFRYPVTIGQFWIPTVPAPIQTVNHVNGGSITMNVKSSHSVVKCGEIITLNVNFQNTSFRNLTGVRVKLKQVWECTGVFYHKNIVLKYLTKEGYPTSRGPHTSEIEIKVPNRLHTCPTVSNASLFKCTYYLAVYGLTKMAGGLVASDTLKCRIPLTISNLPSTDHDHAAQPAHQASSSDESNSESESDNEENPPRVFPRSLSQTSSESSITSSSSLSSSNSMPILGFDLLNLDNQGNFTIPPRSFNDGVFSSHNELALGLGELFNLDMDNQAKKPVLKKEKSKEKIDEEGEKVEKQDDDPLAKECIVCYDGQKNMLLLPCAHIATCVSCTSYIMYSNKLCPVCRTKITQVMRIYPV